MKKNNIKSKKIILVFTILIGLGLIVYPLLSQIYYDQAISSEVSDFQKAIDAIRPRELIAENVRLAEAYNEALDPNLGWVDPYSEEERSKGVQKYAEMLEVQEKIGVINIPKIQVSLPIYAGTRESILQKGAGHLEGTSLPVGGENTHSVITAHRGLPEARLFTDLVDMELGDIFSVETMAGELFYEVDNVKVVEPHETDEVMITPGEDYLTLLTCTPYMINSHRLLVRGKRIPNPSEDVIAEVRENQEKTIGYYWHTYWYYFVLILVSLMIVGISLHKKR